jgi:Acyl-CoA carboxylase epsilon subunit
MTASNPGQSPALAFTGGNPTAQEIAAVVAVLMALPPPAGPPEAGPAVRSEWPARYRMMRGPLRQGPGAWRASGLPR